MCTVLLPPGGYPIAVNKYIIYIIQKVRHCGDPRTFTVTDLLCDAVANNLISADVI